MWYTDWVLHLVEDVSLLVIVAESNFLRIVSMDADTVPLLLSEQSLVFCPLKGSEGATPKSTTAPSRKSFPAQDLSLQPDW